MRRYASRTGTLRNLEALRLYGWRILFSPFSSTWPDGFPGAIDNGAWTYFQQGREFDGDRFRRTIDRHGEKADWIVIPDKVAAGKESLEFSQSWMHELSDFRHLLLAVQDGMNPRDVSAFVTAYPKHSIGIFLGGSTGWKLRNMYAWGCVAAALGCYYHVARVNTAKRIRLALEAGADSIDGTSASLYSVTVPMLDNATRQPSLLRPQIGCAIASEVV
jgi:hypothetical protein